TAGLATNPQPISRRGRRGYAPSPAPLRRNFLTQPAAPLPDSFRAGCSARPVVRCGSATPRPDRAPPLICAVARVDAPSDCLAFRSPQVWPGDLLIFSLGA